MLKNHDIIAQLTDSQKARLLTSVGSLAGKDFKILGLSGVSTRNMKEYGREIFPRASALSHAWDEQLWREIADAKVKMMVDDGADFAIVPGAKVKISPYRRETSEDPFLAARLSAVHVAAAKAAGLGTALSGYYLTESDEEWMDCEPNERAINEFVTAPYAHALTVGHADAVVTDMRSLSDGYKTACRNMQSAIPEKKYLICEFAGEENTVDFISRGIVCLAASTNALEAAMSRYKKLKGAMDRGEGVTPEQIEAECQSHTAISGEDVDAALDTVIEFIRSKREIKPLEYKSDLDELAFRATVQSSVLLKNSSAVLPLSQNKNIALIGDIFPTGQSGESMLFEIRDALQAKGYRCIGAERGYDLDDIQRSYATEKALRLADTASTVILFLGFGEENERKLHKTGTLELPPNQLKLADMLIKRKRSVIGIIASGHAPDIAFTRGFEAVMLAPLGVQASKDALVAMLTGEVSPSGKLAYTLYAESYTAFRKRELYKRKYGIKSGPFVGYRYYDTAELNLGYPFGHGLTYSKFRYSDMTYYAGKVRVVIENIGSVPATETVQVYAGCTSRTVVRAKKELCGFAKVRLAPREKKFVDIPIKMPRVYQSGSFKTERGVYEIYVGASSSDIRLTRRVHEGGEMLVKDGERLRDYIQSISNVTEDNFTLEANYCPMNKKSYKNLLLGFGLLAAAVSIAVFNSVSNVSSVFLGIMASLLSIFAAVYLVSDVLERSRSYQDDRARIDEKNQEYFAEAERLDVFSTDRMFNDEFDAHASSPAYASESADDFLDDEIAKYVDPGFKALDLAKELLAFAEEKGMRFERTAIESLTASLITSGLVIVDGLSSEDFNAFMLILSEYFASRPHVDRLDGELADCYEVFFSHDAHGDRAKKAAALAIEDAIADGVKINILALDNVNEKTFEQLLKPFTAYLLSPKDKNDIKIYNDRGANVGYNVTKNLKLIIRLEDSAPVDLLPVALLRAASYNHLSFVKCQPAAAHGEYHGCNIHQLYYILEKEGHASDVGEQIYRKIDKLEEYARSRASYGIGNKLWISLERQLSVLLALEKELEEAADIAVATKLLSSVCAVLRGTEAKEDETLKGMIEFIFGEENVSACTRFINTLQVRNMLFAEKIAAEEARKAEEAARGEELVPADAIDVSDKYEQVALTTDENGDAQTKGEE